MAAVSLFFFRRGGEGGGRGFKLEAARRIRKPVPDTRALSSILDLRVRGTAWHKYSPPPLTQTHGRGRVSRRAPSGMIMSFFE